MLRWLMGCLFLTLVAASPCLPQDANNKRIVGYLVAGGDVDTKLEQIALTKVTHLNLAFENPINDDGDLSFHPNNAKVIAHCKRIGIPVLISICGGSASEKESMRLRYFQLINKTHRSHFVKKLVDYVETHQIDGLDIDLEGPAINEDYDAFIAELAVPLHQKGKLLTCALSQGYGGARVGDATLQFFDFVNVMAYDALAPESKGARTTFIGRVCQKLHSILAGPRTAKIQAGPGGSFLWIWFWERLFQWWLHLCQNCEPISRC